MSEKLRFFSVTIFAHDGEKFPPQSPFKNSRSQEVFLPLDAISHLEPLEVGSPQKGYKIHVKKNYPLDVSFKIKSINPGRITADQVEIIKYS